MKNKKPWALSGRGELLYTGSGRQLDSRFCVDSVFEHPCVVSILMLTLAAVDCCFAYNLFVFGRLSVDSPLVLGVSVFGLVFGFDIVPFFAGIEHRKLQSGMKKSHLTLGLLAGVFSLAVAVNTVLRLLTIREAAPSTSLFFSSADTAAQDSLSRQAIGVCVFGICVPILTSIGAFGISTATFNPLERRLKRLAALIEEKADEIRRLEDTLAAYAAEADFAAALHADDRANYQLMQKKVRVMTVRYCVWVREELMKRLCDPAASNLLANEISGEVLSRFDRLIQALESKVSDTAEVSSAAIESLPGYDSVA